jgi:O-acetylserine/cysteine efflux transporter
MPCRHAVLALVVAACWAVNFVVIDIGLESFPPLLFAALRFGLIAFPAIFFVPRPDVRWPAVIGVGLFSESPSSGTGATRLDHTRAQGRPRSIRI